jgi:hypothetical protein
VLSNHQFDVNASNKQKQQDQDRKKQKIKEQDKEDDAAPVLSSTQMEGKCYCCGKPGHRSPECHKKDKIPKDEWVINKSQPHLNASDDKSTGGGLLASSIGAG